MNKAKPYKPLPSVNALRSFETTARHGSVTRAAKELFVTPSAVSHQIRKLEDSVGHALIEFSEGKAHLTEWGSILAPGLTDGFMRIREAVNLLEDRSRINTLTIASRPFFASKWLSLRIDRFWEKHPEIALRMRYMLEKHRDSSDVVDASIEWHRDAPAGVNAIPLMPAALTPVCSPTLKWECDPLDVPGCLNGQVLLREAHQDFWRDWFIQVGAPEFKPERTVFLDDGSSRLHSCISGKGIDLSVADLLEREFAENLLVEPFPDYRLPGHYFLVLPKSPHPKVIAFQEWILEEMSNANET